RRLPVRSRRPPRGKRDLSAVARGRSTPGLGCGIRLTSRRGILARGLVGPPEGWAGGGPRLAAPLRGDGPQEDHGTAPQGGRRTADAADQRLDRRRQGPQAVRRRPYRPPPPD